jgi:hypothetical protein
MVVLAIVENLRDFQRLEMMGLTIGVANLLPLL